ncbi:MAG: DUF3445 domain-containing protein [Pseudomonadota bacterium]
MNDLTGYRQAVPIFQNRLREASWVTPATRRLPGVQPLDWNDWLRVDDAYAGQMAERERLLNGWRGVVVAEGGPVEELLALVLQWLPFPREGSLALCPDGRCVDIGRGDPWGVLGRLVQCDFCLLEKRHGEHVLTGAVLCFPASWSLAEKMGRPLTAIHEPVASYDGGLAKRVQRLFDAMQPVRPLWRVNALLYDDPQLFQPCRLPPVRGGRLALEAPFVRAERQALVKLPRSGAVVFSIHTSVVRRARLTRHQLQALKAYPIRETAAKARRE